MDDDGVAPAVRVDGKAVSGDPEGKGPVTETPQSHGPIAGCLVREGDPVVGRSIVDGQGG